jgi:hypothetical protein
MIGIMSWEILLILEWLSNSRAQLINGFYTNLLDKFLDSDSSIILIQLWSLSSLFAELEETHIDCDLMAFVKKASCYWKLLKSRFWAD